MNKKAPNPTDRYIGGRVRMRRLQLALSQEKLADKLDLTFQQVQKYEKGANRIGGSRMLEIANALQVTPAYFYEGCPTTFEKGAPLVPAETWPTDFITTNDGLAIARAFMAIRDKKLRRAFVDLIEQAAESIGV